MMSRAELVLVGLMVLVLALFPEASIATEDQQCTSSCGNIPKISYPFRLNTDPPKCGDQRFNLACENNRTTLYACAGKFFVQEINYDQYRLRVVDANLDEDICSILHYSSGISDSCLVPYYLYTSDFIGLMNCTQPVKSSFIVDASAVTPCINNSSSPKTHLYAFSGFLSPSDVPELCSIQIGALTMSPYIRGLSIFDIHHELLQGFDLVYGYYIDRTPPFMERLKQRFQYLWYDLRYHLFSIAGYHNLIGGVEYYTTRGRVVSIIIKGFFIGRTLLGMICFIALFTYKLRQRHLSSDDTIEEFLQSCNNFMPIRYSYSQIKEMTKGFNDKLGQGGFGSVYKGKTRSGHLVAVKVLGTSKANGQDFITEVATIGRIHHVNVVRLIGFCAEGSKRALLYDFMTNGSLDRFIFHTEEQINLLSWERMYEIVLGVAQGIEYLHRGCDMQILHFDIKPHNILLDENFIPKISDFGLAKLYAIDNSIVSLTAARGTLGYIAPELFYKNIGGVSYKADVYSFGMLLMEMVGKRKNVNICAEHSSQIYFPTWIYNQISQGEDIELGGANEHEQKFVRKMIIVALWCIQMNPIDRPSMSKVLQMLEGAVELLEMPPKPLDYPWAMSVVDHAGNNSKLISSINGIGTITLDVR